jgi:Na+/H+ antiporter NhaC
VLHTVMAFLPLAFLIVYALKTRKMADAMVLATLLAVLLVHRQHFFTGLIDAMYTTLGNSSYQFALCSILGFGGMISLFQASGGLMGFRDLLAKAANTPRKTLLLAWLLSVIMFVDEYLNALTTTICLRDVSDKNRLPREHLAVQTNIMACCLCVTVPFTSWTAFSVGLISDFGLGFTDYLQAVPFMFYPLAFVLVGLTVFAVGGCWAVMTIAIPVFIPMGLAAGVAAPLMIAAVMSGVTLGYSLCFYADAVLMTTAGSGVSNLTTIRAATPYALAVGGLSVIALLVAGL